MQKLFIATLQLLGELTSEMDWTTIMRDIDFEIIRSKRRKRFAFRTKKELSNIIEILAPMDATDEIILKLINNNKYTIYKMMEEHKETHRASQQRTKDTYLYLDKEYPLIVDPKINGLEFNGKEFKINNIKNKEKLFKEFYSKEIIKLVDPFVEKYKKILDVQPNNIKSKNMKNAWGQAHPNGNIDFNWMLSMVPEHIIEYVVAHELTHLIHLNHSPKFWRKLGSLLPNYKSSRDWLKNHISSLTL